jgi:hypothetical protein
LLVNFQRAPTGNDLGGSATVGAYAGYAYPGPQRLCKPTVCPTFIPLISAGLSQVSVDKDDGAKDTKSAIAIAGGIIITSWGDLNIGLVAGVDWSGDRDYAHEGEAWLSFMIGWDLASKKTD